MAALGISTEAHESGVSHEAVVGDYRIDIGYDPERPRAGDKLLFDFALVDAESGTAATFDSVWVRVEQEGATVLATGVGKAVFGPTTLFMMTPHTPAPLTISARFQNGEDILAESSFEIPVTAAPDTGTPGWVLGALIGLAGLVVGFIIGMFIVKRQQHL